MSNEDNDITLVGDESAIEAREAGFLPGRNIAPAEEQPEPADEAAFEAELQAELEVADDPIAEIAEQQAEMLDDLGVDEPDGWVASPESADDIAANREILNQLLGLDGLSASERQEVVEDALWRYQMGEASGAAIADDLGSYDPKAADAFVMAWQAEERAQMSANEYAENQARVQGMLERAKEYAAQAEEAKKAEEATTAAFEAGLAQFKANLTPAERAFQERAYQVFHDLVSNPQFDAETPLDADGITRALRFALNVAQQMSYAKAAAQLAAEWDQLNTAPGYMNTPDDRLSYSDHLAAEIQKRMAAGQMTAPPLTHAERASAVHKEFDDAEARKWDGWDLASRPAPSRPSEPDAEDQDPWSLDTELERVQRTGWNVGPR